MSEKKEITFGKIFWPSLVAVLIVSLVGILIFMVFLGGIIGSLGEEKTMIIEKNTVLRLTLEGDLAEKSSVTFDPAGMGIRSTTGLADILYGFERAGKDKKIKGVFLEIKDARCGMAMASEIRRAINRFEKKGKFVVAYLSGELITQKQYYIASAANELYAFPTSMMEFVGLGAELTFFKGTLDKLGIEVQVIRGRENDFKSAIEPFFLDKMSDSSRMQVHRYLTTIWSDMRTDISGDRGVSAERLFEIAENMEIKRAEDAVSLKLLDGVKYRDEVIGLMAKRLNIKRQSDLRLTSFEKYAKRKFRDNQSIVRMDNPNIAVLIAEGNIAVNATALNSEKLCEELRTIRADENIKALVLRINSPGGSALASEEIWREISLLKSKMKVIVSMGDVAASGGYYIATPADYIFAESTTITGSIGVFGVIPYTGKFLEDKLGLAFDRVSTNKHAVITPNRRPTAEENAIIQNEIDQIYTEFIERVAEGRKMTKEQVHKLARGRVWTGSDALKIGLVDQLGGLNAAISYARKSARLKTARIIYYPQKKDDPFEAIIELLEEQESEGIMTKNRKIPAELLEYYDQLIRVKSLQGIQMRLPYELKID